MMLPMIFLECTWHPTIPKNLSKVHQDIFNSKWEMTITHNQKSDDGNNYI